MLRENSDPPLQTCRGENDIESAGSQISHCWIAEDCKFYPSFDPRYKQANPFPLTRMQRPKNIRQGDRSEYLANFILSAFAITTQVPRQEDFQGIDFHCSLLKLVDGNLQPFAPFNVQIKSSSETYVEYGGLTGDSNSKTRRWRGHELQALINRQTPLFIGSVNKEQQRLDLFQTSSLAFLWGKKAPFVLRLILNDPTETNHLGPGVQTSADATIDSGYEPVIWNLPIGRPILSIPIADSENEAQVELIKDILLQYILLDQRNITLQRAGLAHFHWPLVIRPNECIREIGVMAYALSNPKPLLDVLSPAIASLVSTYKHRGEKEKIKEWHSTVSQLPGETPDDKFLLAIIDEAMRFANNP